MSEHSAEVQAILEVLENVRITARHEDEAQEQIQEALTAAGIDCEREVRLSTRDRVDVLAGRVVIEVKTSPTQVERLWRQVQRYADHDEVDAVIVASTLFRNLVRLPDELAGTPVIGINIGRIM